MPDNHPSTRWMPLVVLATGAFVASCSPPADRRVTGKNNADPTWGRQQAETAINVSHDFAGGTGEVISITFNDLTETDSTILYTDSDRAIYPGASLLGWAYSDDHRQTWKYGGKVTPPEGWAVLWGDPAITHLKDHFSTTTPPFYTNNQGYVFISNLAITNEDFAAAASEDGAIHGALEHLSGACFARSTDFGRTFANWGCLSNNSHFYDGGSIVANETHVFAAYWDVNTKQVDVWLANAKDDLANFVSLGEPFPGYFVSGHAEMRIDEQGALWVMAPVLVGEGNGHHELRLTTLQEFRWIEPVNPAPGLALGFAPAGVVPLGPFTPDARILRTAQQYSFDIGRGEYGGAASAQVRTVAASSDGVRYNFQGYQCPVASLDCSVVQGWTSGAAGDHFSPLVTYGYVSAITGQGQWKLTYYSNEDDPNGVSIAVEQANLLRFPDGTGSVASVPLTVPHLVCSDNRGYWGDYDGLVALGAQELGGPNEFIVAYSDSSAGCYSRREFTSGHVHVSAMVFQ